MAWNGSNVSDGAVNEKARGKKSQANGTPAPTWLRGAVAGLVIVIAGVAAMKFLLQKPAQPTEPESQPKQGLIEEVTPVAVKSAELEVTNVVDEVEESKPAYDPNFQANYPRTPGHLPLPGGNVVTFKPPAPGCTAEVYTVGGLYLCDSDGNFTKYEPPKIFDNRFENTLESLVSDRMLILSDHTKNFSQSEIATRLATPIVINEDDPPDIVERKTATAAMKDEIYEFIKQGGTYQEYIDLWHNRVANERSLHREAVREVIRLLSEGDIEGARESKAVMDSFLNENGYMGMKLPDSWQRKLDGLDEDDE